MIGALSGTLQWIMGRAHPRGSEQSGSKICVLPAVATLHCLRHDTYRVAYLPILQSFLHASDWVG